MIEIDERAAGRELRDQDMPHRHLVKEVPITPGHARRAGRAPRRPSAPRAGRPPAGVRVLDSLKEPTNS